MNIYRAGVIGCGRIASLMEQDEHRDKPTTHAGCYDVVQRTQIVAAGYNASFLYELLDSKGRINISERVRPARFRLRNGSGWMDLLIYTLSLPNSPDPLRSQGDYYGGRKQWQTERVASSGRGQY
jgi:hypothetical protein